MRILPLILLAAVLGLTGCQVRTWQPGGATHTSPLRDYTVRVPENWMFLARPLGLVATNDGLLLQRAGLQRHNLVLPLVYSKRKLEPNLTPLELAEAIADDMRANRDYLGLEFPEIAPAEVGGRPGFKLVMRFHDPDGLRFTKAVYGCTTSEVLYLLHYQAPTRHYFSRDQPAFEALVRSFKILETRPIPPAATPPVAENATPAPAD